MNRCNLRILVSALIAGMAMFCLIANVALSTAPEDSSPSDSSAFQYAYFQEDSPLVPMAVIIEPPIESLVEPLTETPVDANLHDPPPCPWCPDDFPHEDTCDCSCYWLGPHEPWKWFDQYGQSDIRIGGWASIGYHTNPIPRSVQRADGLAFNDVPDRLNAHQAWFYVEKDAIGDNCCWEWGYRLDIMYGTDAQKTQAFGNSLSPNSQMPSGWDNEWDHGTYGWAMPQAYVELARGDLSIIAGHFYTLIGYEMVTAPNNFFYSHALTMFNSEPFTHTGVLATYCLSDKAEVYAGWTLGWDTGFDQFGGGSSFLGGLKLALSNKVNLTYITTNGDFGARGANAYSHSVVLDAQLNDKLNYVLHSDLVDIDGRGGAPPVANNDQVSINQYLIYRKNDCCAIGGRLEWWKSDGTSFYEMSGGLNFRPHANITVRPEIRYDWQGNLLNPAGQAVSNQTTFGIDAVFTF